MSKCKCPGCERERKGLGGYQPCANRMAPALSERPACNCPVRSGAHDYDCPVHWFEWSEHLDQQMEQANARVSKLEAALRQARAKMHQWSDYVPEHFQEKWGLERDLCAIDAVIGDD